MIVIDEILYDMFIVYIILILFKSTCELPTAAFNLFQFLQLLSLLFCPVISWRLSSPLFSSPLNRLILCSLLYTPLLFPAQFRSIYRSLLSLSSLNSCLSCFTILNYFILLQNPVESSHQQQLNPYCSIIVPETPGTPKFHNFIIHPENVTVQNNSTILISSSIIFFILFFVFLFFFFFPSCTIL